MITSADFKIQFPEFAAIDDDRVQYWITKSATYIGPNEWGTFYDEGVAYWVAHRIASGLQNVATQTESPDEVGAIMKKAGDTAIQFSDKVALAKLTGDSYLSTEYGQYFLQLRRTIGFGMISV